MRKILTSLVLLAALSSVVNAQNALGPVGPGTVNPPCAAFGVTAATCAQGNDTRLISAPLTFTPTDASGSAISFSSKSGTYVTAGKWIFFTLSVVYPSIAVDTNAAKIGSLPCASINVAEGNTQVPAATGAALALEGIVLQNTTNASVVTLTGAATVTNSQLSLATVRLSGSYICQ